MRVNKIIVKNLILLIGIGWGVLLFGYVISRYYQIEWNASTSMPQKLWVTHVGDTKLKVGDYVVIKFHDFRMLNPHDYEYVVKQVGGVAGDLIMVRKWNGYKDGTPQPNKNILIYVLPTGTYQVFDIISGNHFTPLTTVNMTIPEGCYFLHGQQHPSFDSRYKEFGLICKKQIYGRTYPIF